MGILPWDITGELWSWIYDLNRGFNGKPSSTDAPTFRQDIELLFCGCIILLGFVSDLLGKLKLQGGKACAFLKKCIIYCKYESTLRITQEHFEMR